MTKRIVAIAALAITASSVFYSCKKETTATPETTTQQTSVKRAGGSGGFNTLQIMEGKMRKVYSDYSDCYDADGNCHPEDIVITAPKMFELDNAISRGAHGVSTLFANNETAVAYIPEWNTTWFADVKGAILSGQYTFVKAGVSMYLLGKAGVVSTTNFDYAILYKVQ